MTNPTLGILGAPWNPYTRSDSQKAMVVRNPFLEVAAELPGMEGVVLGERYRIERKIGSGGMADVYLAEHLQMRKRVAVKVLQRDLCYQSDFRARFMREAQATAHLDHENIVEVTDCGETPDGSVFLVMELLDGEELSQTIAREGCLPVSRLKHIALQVCAAVQAAHDQGVLHRDLKPENCVRITRSGDEDVIKVLDFGLAKIARESHLAQGPTTAQGTILGTPAYMSPEQCRGATTDPRSDVYALGVMLYELATGERPFRARNAAALISLHLNEAPRSPRSVAPSLPAQLETLILKALAKDPSDRFGSVAELAAALRRVPDSDDSPPGPSSRAHRRHGVKMLVALALAQGAVLVGLGAHMLWAG